MTFSTKSYPQCVKSTLFLVVAVAALLASVSTHSFNSDEGVTLSAAWHLLLGKELYTDLFEYVTPASMYLIAALWKVTGQADYISARIFSAALVALACWSTYRTTSLIAGRRLSAWPALVLYAILTAGNLVNHNTLFVLPATVAVQFAVRHIVAGRVRNVFWSGLCAGISVLFLQHKGVALLMGILIGGLAVLRPVSWREVARLVGMFALGVVLPLLVLLHWDVDTLTYNLLVFPSRHYVAVQKVSPAPLVVACVILAWIFWQVRPFIQRSVWTLIAIVQTVLLVTTLQRPDVSHVFAVIFPSVALYPIFSLHRASWSNGDVLFKPRVINFVGLALSCLAFTIAFKVMYINVNISRNSAEMRTSLLASIAEGCVANEFIYAGPFIPWLYFEARKINLTRYSVLLEGMNTDAQFRESEVALRRNQPACVVLEGELAQQFGHSGNNMVEEFLRRNYRLAWQQGSIKILRRP